MFTKRTLCIDMMIILFNLLLLKYIYLNND